MSCRIVEKIHKVTDNEPQESNIITEFMGKYERKQRISCGNKEIRKETWGGLSDDCFDAEQEIESKMISSLIFCETDLLLIWL